MLKNKTKSKTIKLIESFSIFCQDNPDLRFWQALRAWSAFEFILVSNKRSYDDLRDTFYFKGKTK